MELNKFYLVIWNRNKFLAKSDSPMNKLNNNQLKQQDFVDNEIYKLLCNINPSQREIEWNIEAIGEIRDLIQLWLVERLAITDEMTFYPFIDTNS